MLLQDQLTQCKPIVQDANWNDLRLILPRIKGPPGSVRDNMLSVIALMPDGPAAAKMEDLVGEFVDSFDGIDYAKYYDTMPGRKVRSGLSVLGGLEAGNNTTAHIPVQWLEGLLVGYLYI